MDTELDLLQILITLRKKIWLIISLTLLFAIGAYLITSFLITPKYSATVSLYVYNEKDRTDVISQADLSTSQKLVQTYIVVLTSNTVLNKVSDKLDGDFSAAQIRAMIDASSLNNTEAFEITVTHENPAAAQRIANTIAEIAPEEIIRVVKAGDVTVIDKAELPKSPSSPSIVKNTVIGALIGCVIAVAIAILAKLFDTVIHSDDELSILFDKIPVIGIIPSMEEHKGSGGAK